MQSVQSSCQYGQQEILSSEDQAALTCVNKLINCYEPFSKMRWNCEKTCEAMIELFIEKFSAIRSQIYHVSRIDIFKHAILTCVISNFAMRLRSHQHTLASIKLMQSDLDIMLNRMVRISRVAKCKFIDISELDEALALALNRFDEDYRIKVKSFFAADKREDIYSYSPAVEPLIILDSLDPVQSEANFSRYARVCALDVNLSRARHLPLDITLPLIVRTLTHFSENWQYFKRDENQRIDFFQRIHQTIPQLYSLEMTCGMGPIAQMAHPERIRELTLRCERLRQPKAIALCTNLEKFWYYPRRGLYQLCKVREQEEQKELFAAIAHPEKLKKLKLNKDAFALGEFMQKCTSLESFASGSQKIISFPCPEKLKFLNTTCSVNREILEKCVKLECLNCASVEMLDTIQDLSHLQKLVMHLETSEFYSDLLGRKNEIKSVKHLVCPIPYNLSEQDFDKLLSIFPSLKTITCSARNNLIELFQKKNIAHYAP